MSFEVSLRDIVNEMTEISDRHTAFLNRRTGELITMNDSTRALLDAAASDNQLNEEQRGLLAMMHEGELIELPGKYEQRLFTIVEQFCETVRDPDHRERLRKAIRGKRAFREFKKTVKELGLRDRWTGYRNHAFEELAIDWLQRHGIAFRSAA